MEDEACLFNKFGYCKFNLNCKRIHYREMCQENQTCEAKIECKKRHPKKYETERGCRFGFDCRYLHVSQQSANKVSATKPMSELQDKVDNLEKSLSELTEKVVGQIAKKNWATRQSGESPNKKSAEPRKWNWSAQKKEYSIWRTQGELGV